MASLNTIPYELVHDICETLPWRSICALRLTDRRLAQATLKPFGELFRSISATCSISGLEHLASNIWNNVRVKAP
ncbi:hypothetical protein K491DRAFT_20162 [Lophiostoma macrostomum CBS 122681]|uniref:F-box domain-containing protein n=1 Tax=Lophiostoma macrostomum CBS 122681 TaxID=1314788 RepID=A0A6A6TPT1_9PLEO|nr:hypothetical protein K491DRAFT_20162 [Lophiostoma macrostomum CBS 122681]